MYAPVVADFDVGCDHDLPGMTVRIGKIPGVAAVIGRLRRLEELRTFRDREIENLAAESFLARWNRQAR